MAMRTRSILATLVLSGAAASLHASTGNFTSPLTNAFLSVDINGGPLPSAATATNGWNENTGSGGFSADNFGVLWTGWGGNTYAGGDGTQLPSSQSAPNVNSSSINKTFSVGGSAYYGVTNTPTPTVTATVSESGTASDYAQRGGSPSMDSRDRGSPSGANGLNDNDMFRDFIYGGTSGGNVQGSNYLQLQLTGLNVSTAYQIALYSYDEASAHSENWTATAPTLSNDLMGYWAASPVGNNTFAAPSDEQTITWVTGGSPTPAPAIFTLTSDATGTINLWTFGGSGTSGDQSSSSSYFNGFQIAAAVPEPGSLGMVALAGLAMLRRRRVA